MPITLTTPESSAPATTVELVSFVTNITIKYAEANFRVGFKVAGEFTTTRKLKIVYQDNSDTQDSVDARGNQVVVKSFAGLVQRSNAAKQLRNELEQDAISVGAVDGTIT